MLLLIPPHCLPPSYYPPSPPPSATTVFDFLTPRPLYHPTIHIIHHHLILPSLIYYHILLFFQYSLCLMLVQFTTRELHQCWPHYLLWSIEPLIFYSDSPPHFECITPSVLEFTIRVQPWSLCVDHISSLFPPYLSSIYVAHRCSYSLDYTWLLYPYYYWSLSITTRWHWWPSHY